MLSGLSMFNVQRLTPCMLSIQQISIDIYQFAIRMHCNAELVLAKKKKKKKIECDDQHY